jgi:heme/copper-type cytochrome/quinol oxidase subunit 1
MAGRQKTVKVLAAVQAVVALCIIIEPKVLFPVCDNTMHCYFSYMAEIGSAAALLAASGGMLLSKGMEAPRMLGIVCAVIGVFVILYPSTLIGVCGSPRMACHYGAMPVWNLLGGATIIVSGIIALIAKEEKV